MDVVNARLSYGDLGTGVDVATLSPRERECACWSALGKSALDTAGILGISVHTVRQHLIQARRKLHADSREQMILRAAALGILSEFKTVAA